MNGQESRVSIYFITGVDAAGENIIRAKHFNNVKGDATDESLVSFVNSLYTLQQHSMETVTRNNSYALI